MYNETAYRVLSHAIHMVRVRPDGPDRDVAILLLRIVGSGWEQALRTAMEDRERLMRKNREIMEKLNR
jgi:hypothetical protein